ncbi:MAG TPA: DinB family protein [Thermoanaerobaculia bacterium]|nr:DinB family protein [Thermoanaerobaculia bacterium]
MNSLTRSAVSTVAALALLAAFPAARAQAQMGGGSEPHGKLVAVAQKSAPTGGFRAEFLHNLDDAQKEIQSLAEAVPAEKYSWRPAPGVRSVAEVYLHIARSNFGIPQVWGAKLDDPSIDLKNLEKLDPDKAKVVDALNKSFAFVRRSVDQLKESDIERSISLFGTQSTVRGAMLVLITHMHEHLGQSIAYARINGVVPPWSAASAPAGR